MVNEEPSITVLMGKTKAESQKDQGGETFPELIQDRLSLHKYVMEHQRLQYIKLIVRLQCWLIMEINQ